MDTIPNRKNRVRGIFETPPMKLHEYSCFFSRDLR
jgi:hypothetical protein